MLIHTALVIIAYLAGSLASAVLVCKALGLGDPRQGGSGNPGATNVLRLYGKTAALLTLAGDVLKGLLPVLLLRYLHAPDLVIALGGLAAFVGHLYPLFFGLRGGKGVATLIGVLLGFNWLSGAAFIITWLLVALVSRYSSVAALSAALLTPLYCWLILPAAPYITVTGVMSALLIWRHRSNMQNLLRGTETRIRLGR